MCVCVFLVQLSFYVHIQHTHMQTHIQTPDLASFSSSYKLFTEALVAEYKIWVFVSDEVVQARRLSSGCKKFGVLISEYLSAQQVGSICYVFYICANS